MKTIRWGIIGCGDVTEVKSGPGFQKAQHSALVAVMRRNADKARDYAQRHGVARWYDDANKLIADPEVDIVYIATPPDSHEDYTVLCAKAGKPVYVEKPMARTHEECAKMIAACRKANVPLFTAYYRRSLPRFLKIRDLVNERAIGDVRYVQIQLHMPPEKDELNPKSLPWRVIPDIAGAGRFLDLACHTLDILDFILGPIASARGQAGNQGRLYAAEDIVTAEFDFESGAFATGVWCFTSYESYDMVEIVGSKGKIRFPTFTWEPIELHSADGVQEFDIQNPPHIQQPHIQSIVNELNGAGKCPSSGISAARTSFVMDEILKDWRAEKNQP